MLSNRHHLACNLHRVTRQSVHRETSSIRWAATNQTPEELAFYHLTGADVPNGKPGDHPYTDIVVHGHDFYTDDIDELIRKIDKYGGREALSDIDLLSYGWHPDDKELTDLRQRLEDVWTSISRSSD